MASTKSYKKYGFTKPRGYKFVRKAFRINVVESVHLSLSHTGGRKRKVHPTVRNKMIKDLKNRGASYRTVASKYNVSHSTVFRYCSWRGAYKKDYETKPLKSLHSKIRGPPYKPRERAKRYNFCFRWIYEKIDIRQCLWMDESHKSPSVHDNMIHDWDHVENSRCPHRTIRHQYNYYSKVPFAVSFTYHNKGPIHIYGKLVKGQWKSSRLTAQYYVENVLPEIAEFAYSTTDSIEKYWFIQDNATSHTAHMSMEAVNNVG